MSILQETMEALKTDYEASKVVDPFTKACEEAEAEIAADETATVAEIKEVVEGEGTADEKVEEIQELVEEVKEEVADEKEEEIEEAVETTEAIAAICVMEYAAQRMGSDLTSNEQYIAACEGLATKISEKAGAVLAKVLNPVVKAEAICKKKGIATAKNVTLSDAKVRRGLKSTGKFNWSTIGSQGGAGKAPKVNFEEANGSITEALKAIGYTNVKEALKDLADVASYKAGLKAFGTKYNQMAADIKAESKDKEKTGKAGLSLDNMNAWFDVIRRLGTITLTAAKAAKVEDEAKKD
jgi:DNA-binding transcriptional MerR regulator